MGCICSKGISANEYGEGNVRIKESRKSSKRLVSSSRKEDVVVEVDNGGHEATTRLISTEPAVENVESSMGMRDEIEKAEIVVEKSVKPQIERRETLDAGVSSSSHLQIARVLGTNSGANGSQASPGWPPWLTAVAGEAIKGWVPRKADSFEKLDKIGQGTYSSVYRARDLETGKIVALKKVRFVNMDPESVRFMAREIIILRRLDHPNVMKLEGLVTSRVSGNLYLVFEYMEHDLAGLIASPAVKFTEPQIKCYMRQLFRGLEYCHSRGVLHRDIKGSNLLIDNNGNLKIGDFGLATFYRSKQPLTSRVVTLWYRPPELLLGATNYGVSVDLWSAGCILAELYSGKPIMPGRTEVEQLHKIFKLCGSPSEEYWQRSRLPHATIFKPQHPYKRTVAEVFKDFPSSVLTLLDVLLAVEPESRGSASSALHSEYFTTKPLPCDLSSLPKYPPSKEFDAKLREEEARRQKAASVKGQPQSAYKKGSRESKAVPAPDANAELQESILKRYGQSNARSNSEIYNPVEGGAGFRMEASRGRPQDNLSHSGQLVRSNGFGSLANEGEIPMGSQHSFTSSLNNGSVFKSQKSFGHQGLAQLSRFSNSVALRGSSRYDMSRDTSINPNWPEERLNGVYNQTDDAESSVNHDLSHHLLEKSHKKGEMAAGKESTMVYASKKNRIHYSGPLLPPGGNIEEILKEHEKQIQHAVRKARMDKTKARKLFGDNGVTESLLHHGGGISH